SRLGTTPSLSYDLDGVAPRPKSTVLSEATTSSLSYDIDGVTCSVARLHHSLEARLVIHR
uniref:hypothetical protein n=1 Tax=Curtobacterium sp. GC_Cur_2 TaxID=2937373 RepID=UPI00226B0F58